jgi:hypothetical protein
MSRHVSNYLLSLQISLYLWAVIIVTGQAIMA